MSLADQMRQDAERFRKDIGPAPGYEAFLMSEDNWEQLQKRAELVRPKTLPEFLGIDIFTHRLMTDGTILGGTRKQIRKIIEYLDACPNEDAARMLVLLFREAGLREKEDGTLELKGNSFTVEKPSE